MVNPLYQRRLEEGEVDLRQVYGLDDTNFTIRLHHGGEFTEFPRRQYVNGKVFTGKVFKQHLCKCATATTVPHFEKAMLELKGFSKECHTYLSKIPPSCWSRSHFSGRCKSDVLINNICEVFNRWLVDARDKPIVTCLEYIREYLMQRIVTVIEKSANTDGPFTPGGKKMFDLVRKEATKLQVLWSGNELYKHTLAVYE